MPVALRPRPSFLEVLCAVATHTGLSATVILERRLFRGRDARTLCVLVAHAACAYSYPEIAEHMGYTAHSTVVDLARRATDEMHAEAYALARRVGGGWVNA